MSVSVTLADVAKVAGLSPSTVSRALSAPDKVNAETCKRVRQIARELGYVALVPRKAAPARTEMIGLVVPDIANPFFPPIIKAIQARVATRGKLAVISDVDEYVVDEIRRARFFSSRVEGLIIASARSEDHELLELAQQVPLVLVNRECPGISSVTIENAAGIFEAVEHLAALGHRTISYLGGPRRSWSNAQRHQAVVDATAQAGLELVEFGPFEPQIQAGARAADLVLASLATAVIAYDDLIALGVMARLNERGVEVGRHMSIIGVDDSPMSGMAYPSLTTIHVPGAEAGAQAVDLLIDGSHGSQDSEPRQRTVQLDTRLVVRGSTAPAPADSR